MSSSLRITKRLLPVLAVGVFLAAFAPVPALVESVGATAEPSAPVFDDDTVPAAQIAREALDLSGDTEVQHDEGDKEAHSTSGVGPDEQDTEQADAGVSGELAVGSKEPTHEFHTIGVTMAEESDVYLRVRDSDGNWEEWMNLAPDPSEGPDLHSAEADAATANRADPAARYATEPVWVDDATAYEVAVDESLADSVEVLTIRDVPQFKVAVTDRQADAATNTPFSMHHRSEWTSQAPKAVSVASSVNMAVVHHSVTPNSYSPSQVPSRLRGIQNYHMNTRGWSDIGYNFAVDKYGGVWEARGGGYDRPVVGAHASGFNTGSVGIVVLGDYSSTASSTAANESVAQVAGWKLFRHGHDPNESAKFTSGGGPRYPSGTRVTLPRIVGHTQVGSTECPGRILDVLPSIRFRAQQVHDFLRAVQVAPGTATGSITAASVAAGTVRVSAKFSDPSASGLSLAILEVDDTPVAQIGSTGSIAFDVPGIVQGRHQVCITVIHRTTRSYSRIDCRSLWVPGSDPIGAFTSMTNPATGRVRIRGWALDPETKAPIDVVAITDKKWVRSVAKLPNADTRAPSALLSANRGYEFDVATGSGNHTVCVVAMNHGGGDNKVLGCRKMVVK